MIHHVSIPAREPERVARVLGELLGGYVGPFVGPFPGSWVAYAEDAYGTGFEVYRDGTVLVPGDGDAQSGFEIGPPARGTAFHALVTVKADRATIERIGAREGWRTKHFWRGPTPDMQLFELYEMWIENRVLLELVTEEMVANYVRIANGAGQRALLAQLPARVSG
jgi:hypothetical protein